MRLTDLEPVFYKIEKPGHFREVDTLADAQGLRFLCPLCFVQNSGPIGTHCVLTWFRDRGVPDDEVPGPARWIVAAGTSFEDLSLTPSILLTSEGCCAWHGFITAGEVT